MSRGKRYPRQGPLLIAALLVTALAAALAACNVGQDVPTDDRPATAIVTYGSALDVATGAPCPQEDGPGVSGGPVPCVWDSATRGCSDAEYARQHPVCASARPAYGARWYLYVETCPVATVQDPADVQCIGRDDWSGK